MNWTTKIVEGITKNGTGIEERFRVIMYVLFLIVGMAKGLELREFSFFK